MAKGGQDNLVADVVVVDAVAEVVDVVVDVVLQHHWEGSDLHVEGEKNKQNNTKQVV